MKFSILKNRSVIKIAGSARLEFLQSLLTNDLTKLDSQKFIYAMLLTPQGRFLYDFFITKIEDGYLLDTQKVKVDELIKKLSMYKLRQDVQIEKSDLIPILKIESDKFDLLSREYVSALPNSEQILFESFENKRMENLIPDADADFVFERTLPLEYGDFVVDGIDFKKGCYVGQEVMARSNYRGVIRKTIYKCTFEKTGFLKGEDIIADGKKIGVMLGFNKTRGIALLNNEEFEKAKSTSSDFLCNEIQIRFDE